MLIEVAIKCQTGAEAVLCYMLDVKKSEVLPHDNL